MVRRDVIYNCEKRIVKSVLNGFDDKVCKVIRYRQTKLQSHQLLYRIHWFLQSTSKAIAFENKLKCLKSDCQSSKRCKAIIFDKNRNQTKRTRWLNEIWCNRKWSHLRFQSETVEFCFKSGNFLSFTFSLNLKQEKQGHNATQLRFHPRSTLTLILKSFFTWINL